MAGITARMYNVTDDNNFSHEGDSIIRRRMCLDAASTSSFYGGYGPAQDFQENHSAFKVMVGVRPISLLGG